MGRQGRCSVARDLSVCPRVPNKQVQNIVQVDTDSSTAVMYPWLYYQYTTLYSILIMINFLFLICGVHAFIKHTVTV